MDFSLNLTEEPIMHPDCCVAISRNFLTFLLDILPPNPALVLSVGSGTGYLEAFLLHLAGDGLNLSGVEISPGVNKYLPEQNFLHVPGTWSLYEGAASADVLLFVYPREPRLVARYIEQYGQASCQQVIWIGPTLDWPEYEAVFMSSDFNLIDLPADCGVSSYETLSIATRSSHRM